MALAYFSLIALPIAVKLQWGEWATTIEKNLKLKDNAHWYLTLSGINNIILLCRHVDKYRGYPFYFLVLITGEMVPCYWMRYKTILTWTYLISLFILIHVSVISKKAMEPLPLVLWQMVIITSNQIDWRGYGGIPNQTHNVKKRRKF